MKRIENYQPKKIIYIGYKEPLIAVDKKYFGYEGVISEDEETGMIQCHICGEWFHGLATHLKNRHKDFLLKNKKENVTSSSPMADSYKDMFGLKRGTPIVSKVVSRKIKKRQRENPNYENGIEKKKEWQKEQAKVDKKGIGFNNRQVMEMKNEKGLCYLQLLDQIMKCCNKIGMVVGTRDMKGSNGQILIPTIKRTFGSWREALALIKLEPNKAGGVPQQELPVEYLEYQLIKFRKENCKNPEKEDFNNFLLPSESLYIKHFVSLERAILRTVRGTGREVRDYYCEECKECFTSSVDKRTKESSDLRCVHCGSKKLLTI